MRLSRRKRRALCDLAALVGFLLLVVLLVITTGVTRHRPSNQAAYRDAAADHSEQHQENGLWGWLTHDAAGFFTLVLVGVGSLQAWLFVYQFRLIREGLRDGERAAKAAEQAASAAKESTDLSRLALEAAETPYLVPLIRGFDPEVDKAPPNPKTVPIGSYAFENCGRSPATILEVYRAFGWVRAVPDPVGFPPPASNLLHTEIVAPGRETRKTYITAGMIGEVSANDRDSSAWAIGHVRYADVFGSQFLTGFCFYRNGFSGEWHAIGTPAHNFRRKLTRGEMKIAAERDRLSYYHPRS